MTMIRWPVACPRCGEDDVRSYGDNRCGLCGHEFYIASNGAIYYLGETDVAEKTRRVEVKATWSPEQVRDASVAVYKLRLLQANGPQAIERILAADRDDGEKLRARAASYDALTRAYFETLDVPVIENYGAKR